jgi:multidrug efflux pump subunit AcrA (membrane-fusion protein)
VHEDAYKKQEVTVGANDGINTEILSGIKTGDKVVSKGAYHVKLASASSAIPHGHEH